MIIEIQTYLKMKNFYQYNSIFYSWTSIDCKSFYASVECVARGLHPLTTMLVVLSGADRPGGRPAPDEPRGRHAG